MGPNDTRNTQPSTFAKAKTKAKTALEADLAYATCSLTIGTAAKQIMLPSPKGGSEKEPFSFGVFGRGFCFAVGAPGARPGLYPAPRAKHNFSQSKTTERTRHQNFSVTFDAGGLGGVLVSPVVRYVLCPHAWSSCRFLVRVRMRLSRGQLWKTVFFFAYCVMMSRIRIGT